MEKHGLKMTLELLPTPLAICRLSADAELPTWISGDFQSVTRTRSELSVVCEVDTVPETVHAEKGWRCLRVAGTLEFDLTGILASLITPLAKAQVSVFALSTFDTDYLLIKSGALNAALQVLQSEGHEIRRLTQ